MSEELKPPHPIARVDGSEAFDGIDATVAHFWRWAFSDLRMNDKLTAWSRIPALGTTVTAITFN